MVAEEIRRYLENEILENIAMTQEDGVSIEADITVDESEDEQMNEFL